MYLESDGPLEAKRYRDARPATTRETPAMTIGVPTDGLTVVGVRRREEVGARRRGEVVERRRLGAEDDEACGDTRGRETRPRMGVSLMKLCLADAAI